MIYYKCFLPFNFMGKSISGLKELIIKRGGKIDTLLMSQGTLQEFKDVFASELKKPERTGDFVNFNDEWCNIRDTDDRGYPVKANRVLLAISTNEQTVFSAICVSDDESVQNLSALFARFYVPAQITLKGDDVLIKVGKPVEVKAKKVAVK